MEQYFWEVSITGWASVAIAYAIMREGERKAAARRRAEAAQLAVAMQGVARSMRGVASSMQSLGPAAGRAAASIQRFGEQVREAAYRANQPKGPAPKRRRG